MGAREGKARKGMLCAPPETPERYYNYFSRTGIIKTKTDASRGGEECITLVQSLFKADSFADF